LDTNNKRATSDSYTETELPNKAHSTRAVYGSYMSNWVRHTGEPALCRT